MGFHHFGVELGAYGAICLHVACAAPVLHNQTDFIFLDIVNIAQIIAHYNFFDLTTVRVFALLDVVLHVLNNF